jgi:hypothetical protein
MCLTTFTRLVIPGKAGEQPVTMLAVAGGNGIIAFTNNAIGNTWLSAYF